MPFFSTLTVWLVPVPEIKRLGTASTFGTSFVVMTKFTVMPGFMSWICRQRRDHAVVNHAPITVEAGSIEVTVPRSAGLAQTHRVSCQLAGQVLPQQWKTQKYQTQRAGSMGRACQLHLGGDAVCPIFAFTAVMMPLIGATIISFEYWFCAACRVASACATAAFAASTSCGSEGASSLRQDSPVPAEVTPVLSQPATGRLSFGLSVSGAQPGTRSSCDVARRERVWNCHCPRIASCELPARLNVMNKPLRAERLWHAARDEGCCCLLLKSCNRVRGTIASVLHCERVAALALSLCTCRSR